MKDPAKAKDGAATQPAAQRGMATALTQAPSIAAAAPEPKAMMVPLPSSTSTTLTSSTASSDSVVQAEPIRAFTPEALQNPELQTFVKEVNTMLQRFTRLNQLSLIEDKDFAARVQEMKSELTEPSDAVSWALLDSGATNVFRPAVEREEQASIPVQVQLADGGSVLLRQNPAGSLIPFSKEQAKEKGANTVIVPLGSLVQELGCTISWTCRGLEVVHPSFGVITTHVSGACPFIGESKALELIGELEARKLEQLKVATVDSQLRLRGVETQLSYSALLAEYRRTGSRTDGLRALMARGSAFGDLTEAQRCLLAQDIDLSDKAGHRYLKALPVKRAMRKRLMSTQWLVHLYSGEGGSEEFKVLEDDCVTLLEVDLGISKAFNMKEPSMAYKALLWAAMRGQIHGVVGGPPRGEGCGELVMKQMFIWNLARVTAEEHEVASPAFAMSMPRKSQLWTSEMRRSFRSSLEVNLSPGRPDVVVATNLFLKDNLHGDPWEGTSRTGAVVWTAELRRALVCAIQHHRSLIAIRRLEGPLSTMTKDELARWTLHVKNGHLPYNKRCKTCVAARATGYQHRRIEAPSCHVMSVDICGPFREKGHTPEAMDQKYMLVASYVMLMLSGVECDPGDEIINEPEGGIGDVFPPGDPKHSASDGVLPAGDPKHSASDGVLPAGDLEHSASDGVLPAGDPEHSASDGVLPAGDPEHSASDGVLPAGDPEHPVLDGASPAGVHLGEVAFPDLEGVFDEEEEPPSMPIGDEEQAEWDRLNKEYNELVAEVGDVINYQVLRFAVPLRSRRAAEVNLKVRQLYLQIRAEGFPVWRFHSDRARELCNSRLRTWLAERGVIVTTGEAQSPQQNGRAESTVRFVKTEAKCLLTAARLGKENWPMAMRYATYRQRLKALGKEEDLPQVGCPVHVRTKIYGKAERYDMDVRWREGIYLGPSDDVSHGHVVKFQDNTFVTSQHLKANLVDPDAMVDLVLREVQLPLPERRARRKTRLSALAAEQPLSSEEEEAENFARQLRRQDDHSTEAILQLFDLLKKIHATNKRGRAAAAQGCTWTTGMFVHRGVAGLRGNTTRMKWCTKFLVETAKKLCKHHDFSALGLLENTQMGCHKDSHNDVETANALVMLKKA